MKYLKCNICHKSLTNEVSQSIGIGPVCRISRKNEVEQKRQLNLLKTSRCNYSYEVVTIETYRILMIIDEGGPFRSVTNGIEDVLNEITNEIGGDRSLYDAIIYKDTTGIWDGVKTSLERPIFYSINEKNGTRALVKVCTALNDGLYTGLYKL